MSKLKSDIEEKKLEAGKTHSDEVRPIEYSSMDACICCGEYMPEGSGMVCIECQKKYGLKG